MALGIRIIIMAASTVLFFPLSTYAAKKCSVSVGDSNKQYLEFEDAHVVYRTDDVTVLTASNNGISATESGVYIQMVQELREAAKGVVALKNPTLLVYREGAADYSGSLMMASGYHSYIHEDLNLNLANGYDILAHEVSHIIFWQAIARDFKFLRTILGRSDELHFLTYQRNMLADLYQKNSNELVRLKREFPDKKGDFIEFESKVVERRTQLRAKQVDRETRIVDLNHKIRIDNFYREFKIFKEYDEFFAHLVDSTYFLYQTPLYNRSLFGLNKAVKAISYDVGSLANSNKFIKEQVFPKISSYEQSQILLEQVYAVVKRQIIKRIKENREVEWSFFEVDEALEKALKSELDLEPN